MKKLNKILSVSNLLWGSVLVTAVAFAIYFVIPANYSGSSHSKVKKIYYADNISTAHQELIDRFNEEHAGKIEVVPVNLPFSKFSTNERKELLTRAFRRDRKSTRLNSSHIPLSRMPSSA